MFLVNRNHGGGAMKMDSFLGGVPPVKVIATNCATVTINVKFVTEQIGPETLNMFLAAIDKVVSTGKDSGSPAPVALSCPREGKQ